MGLIIKGGTIVTASDQYVGDIAIEGETIDRIGRDLPSGDARVIDATGMYVIPGAIDAHTHLAMPFGGTVTSDDFETGQIAAACGGTTTHVDYCLQSVGGTLRDALATWHAKAEGKAVIDYGFHMAVTDLRPDVMAELSSMIDQGVTSIKAFMAYKGVFQVDDATLFQLLEQARELGALVNVHAENGDVVDLLTRRLVAAKMSAPKYHAASRPPEVEAEATHRAVALAELARAPLNVVHMTCEASVRHVAAARARGAVHIHGETCPQYLLLDVSQYEEPDFQGARYVMSPPLREAREHEGLWRHLAAGTLQTLMTDHCSFRMADQKALGRDDFAENTQRRARHRDPPADRLLRGRGQGADHPPDDGRHHVHEPRPHVRHVPQEGHPGRGQRRRYRADRSTQAGHPRRRHPESVHRLLPLRGPGGDRLSNPDPLAR